MAGAVTIGWARAKLAHIFILVVAARRPGEEAGMTDENPEAYCVKCKAKRAIADAKQVTMKNGRPALQGKCPVCGTTLNRILPSK